MKKTGLAAILTAGVLLVTSGCGAARPGKTAIQAGDAMATLNDVSIFLSEGDGFEDSKKNYVELMEKTLKYGELGKAMGIELTDEDKKNIIQTKANFASQNGGLSAYKDYLKKAGSSMEFLEMLFTESAYQSKVTEQVEEELGDAEATDEEIEKYFLENYIRAKHILVNLEEEATEEPATEEAADVEGETKEENAETPEPTAVTEEDGKKGEELANLILEKAKNGEDFDKLVETYNQDPGMKDNDDGYIFTEGDMVSEFYDCAKELKPGEFGVVKSSYGYHVIERLPLTKDEKKFGDWLEENKSTVESKIHEDKLEARINELCEEKGITSSIDWDVVNAFTEDMLVKQETAE
ncbi:MAG: peptidylprolyl isomerase [Clostridia bacterium]|nr:peptidylprolyl isomerase [Clostridia bacterium]